MKIERHDLPRMTLTEFADKNDLTIEIHERTHHDKHNRYYAHFKHVEIKEGGILRGGYGDGRTPEEAMANYIPEISGRWLVHNAMTPQRREIVAPIITEVGQ